jgi:hypothetical protein
MKKTLFLLFVILVTFVTLIVPGTINLTNAARGCCMQRTSLNGQWNRNGMNFRKCRDANQSQDRGDNLYSPSGFIWWNENC